MTYFASVTQFYYSSQLYENRSHGVWGKIWCCRHRHRFLGIFRMLAGLVDWNEKEGWQPLLARMQQEVGPFPVSGWRSWHRPGQSWAVSCDDLSLQPPSLEGKGERGLRPPLRGEGDWAVFDGILYNREELTASLTRPGKGDLDPLDEHLVLAAYRRWGASFLERLVGDFALAIWDETTKTLFA